VSQQRTLVAGLSQVDFQFYFEEVLKTIRHFLELIRFSHTIFALPFALLAAVMAWRETEFRARDLIGILVCMVAARSFAMTINRLADRELDAQNPRTSARHLPAGILSVTQVSVFATASAIGFVMGTLLFLPNRLPLYLSVPVLGFLAGYSFAKRFTTLAHFWLGAALGFSPIAAWIAIRGRHVLEAPGDVLPAVVLGVAVLAWVAGFDIIYACQDYEADAAAQLRSVPVRFGIANALRLAAGCHVVTLACLVALPFVYPSFGWIYWSGIAVVAILLVYEHVLVRPDDLSRVNLAFFRVNAVISLGLFAVGSLDLWLVHG
jgi:4-hydroxybenzoate polyprenyltransferase